MPLRQFASRLPGRSTVLFAAACLPCLTACNPFLGNYSGERWPGVDSSRVVMETPSPGSARWIGRSDFTSTGHYGDAEALAAARTVGADLVEWRDRDLGSTLRWTTRPVAVEGWRGSAFGCGPYGPWGRTVAEVPVPVVEQAYRYQARFYRSNVLGGAPLDGTAEVAPSPEVPPTDETADGGGTSDTAADRGA